MATMKKVCKVCSKELSIFKRIFNNSFCSLECKGNYFTDRFNVLLEEQEEKEVKKPCYPLVDCEYFEITEVEFIEAKMEYEKTHKTNYIPQYDTSYESSYPSVEYITVESEPDLYDIFIASQISPF